MKYCKIFQTRNKMGNVNIVARAGKKGTGAILASSEAWDNGRAIDQSLDYVLGEIKKQGCVPVKSEDEF